MTRNENATGMAKKFADYEIAEISNQNTNKKDQNNIANLQKLAMSCDLNEYK